MRVEKPNRVSRSYTQHLNAAPPAVFELLCPVRETEWVNDWRPKLVLSNSGFAEPGCIFITPGIPEDALWLMTEYDQLDARIRRIEEFGQRVADTSIEELKKQRLNLKDELHARLRNGRSLN